MPGHRHRILKRNEKIYDNVPKRPLLGTVNTNEWWNETDSETVEAKIIARNTRLHTRKEDIAIYNEVRKKSKKIIRLVKRMCIEKK